MTWKPRKPYGQHIDIHRGTTYNHSPMLAVYSWVDSPPWTCGPKIVRKLDRGGYHTIEEALADFPNAEVLEKLKN